MENKEDRIIEEIRDSLINYELPYEEGAWEKFREKQEDTEIISISFKDIKGAPFSIRKIMAVAASLILLLSIISVFKAYDTDEQYETSRVVEVKPVNKEGDAKKQVSLPAIIQKETKNEEVKPHFQITAYNTQIVKQGVSKELKIDIEEKNIGIITVPKEKMPVLEEKEQHVEIGDKQPDSNKKEIKPVPFESPTFLSANVGNKENNSDNGETWKFGVELSSSFISDKMNYGGGVFTERKLSDKISLTSGLVFTKINADNEMKPVGISSSTRKVGVESSMQALDIPLSIVYQVSDGFYASMGVSLLSVLSEDKSYQYETDVVSESFVKDPKTGVESTVYSTVTRQYTEPVKEANSKGNDNIGYFNLSVGKRQSFYGKTQLLLEPFLKLPIGKLSDEEVKLMNTGLKIKVMF